MDKKREKGLNEGDTVPSELVDMLKLTVAVYSDPNAVTKLKAALAA